jgi:membrane protein YdbS with pleckstrin-like domain
MTHHDDEQHIFAIERPDAKLWTYYMLSSLLLGPLFFVALIPLYFRYHTLHFRFDQEGISMGWGILFRREIHLTYSRIQDIHLVANFVERWLGLARIQIQTASGSSSAEMTLEGLLRTDEVRDFLYSRMRGARDRHGVAPLAPAMADRAATAPGAAPSGLTSTGIAPAGFAQAGFEAVATTAGSDSDLAAVLAEVAAELRGVRLALEAARGRENDPARH